MVAERIYLYIYIYIYDTGRKRWGYIRGEGIGMTG